MKNLLTKLFPKHETATAYVIVFLLAFATLSSILFLNDYFGKGNKYADEAIFNTGVVVTLLGIAGGVYVFGKKKELPN